MKLKIEQIALLPPEPIAALKLLQEMGAVDWVQDGVVARGVVHGERALNAATLAFNYTALADARELEVLHYTDGLRWVDAPCVSHFGMHVTAAELERWREFFQQRMISVVQEVKTLVHTNPAIAGKRWYHYCIFGTRNILGVDLKFIVRRDEA